ncbi:nuclear transport factor 2 family protein [Mycolicibacterium vinylchloridicum]|uniref:nuclear transport factor 2 family protein n=1 Tax=Mycolicibacterium vinylchloridicum TaxID=2736928 RepID=UPI0015CE1CC4|nr:nuclear transport factor 2 family protein [Mycolicibacterium vinylchloridicum]
MDIRSAVCVPELEVLSRRYASAIDHRDHEALLSVFGSDAMMRIEQPGSEPVVLAGHDQLATVVQMVAGWARTAHLVSPGLYELNGERAGGEVHCTAHHFTTLADGKGHDLVMHIRYQDQYRIGPDDHWRIISRTVLIDATEDRIVQMGGAAR